MTVRVHYLRDIGQMLDIVTVEIATAILLYIVEDDDFDMTELLEKRLIHPSWRTLVDGIPCLWRNVNLLATRRFVDFQMEHAQNVRLNVCVDLDGRSSRYGKEWAVARRGRIVKFAVLTTNEGILMNLMANTSFPLLRILTIRSKASPSHPIINLQSLPTTTLDPLRLLTLDLCHVLYPVSSLAAHRNLSSLSLNYKRSLKPQFHLDELVAILPGLTRLESLSLGGKIEIGEVDPSAPRKPLPLVAFAFSGHMEDLDGIFRVFDLATVKKWRIRVDVQKSGIPKESRLREIIPLCAGNTRKVVLRWHLQSKCFIDFLDETWPSTFDLSIVAFDCAPCEMMRGILDGVGELVSVESLVLHGGSEQLEVGESDDDVIEGMVGAMPNVRSVKVCGNGNSWGRVPVVLVRKMRADGNVWRDLESVEFAKGKCLGYTMGDWVKFFKEKSQKRHEIAEVAFDGWSLQASGEAECIDMTWELYGRVKEVKGAWSVA